ncbi:MAG: tetratricopeptide repeat protein [Pseudomonadota bacterium]
MRTASLIVLALGLFASSAAADQTDPRLDQLFLELRNGEAIAVDETADRIREIWASAASDTVNILYARADEQLQAGRPELAAALLDHVVGLAPSFAQGFALRGLARLEIDESAGALEDFSRVLELEPRHFDVRLTIAGLLLSSDEKRAAYDMLQRALEWNPHDEAARRRARALRRELDGQEI